MIEYLMVRENWDRALNIGMVMLIGFPALLSFYYHTRVRRLRGGKALGKAQRNLAPTRDNVAANLSSAGQMWRRLKSGEFGPGAHNLVKHCIGASVIWVAVVGAWFGVVLYVDAQMMARGGWPELQDAAGQENVAPGEFDGVEGSIPSSE